MKGDLYVLLCILVASGVTALIRFLPFLIFGGGKKGNIPKWVKYLGNVLPAALIAVIVVYGFKNIDASNFAPQLIGGGSAVILHLWFKNELVSIFGATAIYMAMVQFIF